MRTKRGETTGFVFGGNCHGNLRGQTQDEIADSLGIRRQALAERLGRNKKLYKAIKTAYFYDEPARAQARVDVRRLEQCSD